MPIYTYQCSSCDYTEDKLVSLNDSDRAYECKECKSETMHKVFSSSNTNFILKGKGWFKNDGKY